MPGQAIIVTRARSVLPPYSNPTEGGLQLVELWREDLLEGMLEVDSSLKASGLPGGPVEPEDLTEHRLYIDCVLC